jgi:hypothetical protein
MNGVCGQGSVRNRRCDECVCKSEQVKAAKEIAGAFETAMAVRRRHDGVHNHMGRIGDPI